MAAMKIAIVRHGKAHPRSESGRDRDRMLATRGERQARWLGERFAADGNRPELILSSPYERAIATARLINEGLGVPLQTADELACDEPVSKVLALIERCAAHPTLMLVGHNPQLSKLVSLLIGSQEELSTGQAALIDLDLAGPGGPAGRLAEVWRLQEDD
jgi:phosphohistidine phosphatase